MRKMLSGSILDLGKCANRNAHESERECFPVGALCKVQNGGGGSMGGKGGGGNIFSKFSFLALKVSEGRGWKKF